MYDLPSEAVNELGIRDELHHYQPRLLRDTLKLRDYSSESILTSSALYIYYDLENLSWYKRPDGFVVLGALYTGSSREMRMSYVIWQEEVSPFIAVELLAPDTEDEDLSFAQVPRGQPPTKWTVYEKILKIPYYIVYDYHRDILRAFNLVNSQYQPLEIGIDRRIWITELDAGLGLWHGKYHLFSREWLR